MPTDIYFVISDPTPEEERSDGHWVVATEQIRNLHGVPITGVYLQPINDTPGG
jgi:hypothetical protein